MNYFDYAATTPTSNEALDKYVEISKNIYGNPGSSVAAKQLEDKTRKDILKALGCEKTHHLVFTSGGTEANNLAILGVIKNRIPKGSNFITSSFEHASVYDVYSRLDRGNSITFCPSTKEGYIDIHAYKKLLKPTTKFVSFMHVNNELGTEQPVEQLYNITKEFNPNIIFMTDSVQGFGKVKPFNFKPDVFTISSHKIYGPKAVGAVIIRKDILLHNMISGGTKEYGQRAGTQSLPAQVGFSTAVQVMANNLDLYLDEITKLKDYVEFKVSELDNVYLNAKSDSNVVSIFIDVDENASENIKRIYEKGYAISAKSADSNNPYSKSRSLKAIGLSDYRCDRTYRISLSHHKTKADIDGLFSAIAEVIKESNNSIMKCSKIDNLYKYSLYNTALTEVGEMVIELTDDYLVVKDIEIKSEFKGNNFAHILTQKVFENLADYQMDYFITSPNHLVAFFETLGFIKYGVVKEVDGKEYINMIRMYD